MKKITPFRQNCCRWSIDGASLLAAMAMAASTVWVIFGVRSTDLYHMSVIGVEVSTGVLAAGALAGMAASVWWLRSFSPRERLLALSGFLPLVFFLPQAPSIYTLIWFQLAVTFAVFRLAVNVKKIQLPVRPDRFYFWILLFFTAAFIIQGVYIHVEAWKRQYMSFPDTGLFTELAYNTWQGHYFISFWQNSVNFFGDHFEPAFWLLYLPLIGLFPSAVTSMVTGAILLWGSALLLFGFARSRGLPGYGCFLLALCWLLYPAVSNMNLSLIYGFHPDFFFLPVLIAFYWAWEKDNIRWALFFWVFSLLLKETNGAFWFGWGVCQLFGTRRKWGILIGICSLVYFLVCLKLVIPAFRADAGNYQYMREFSALGGSVGEIMLSPFLQLPELLRRLFSARNLLFVILLLLPTVIAAAGRRLEMFSGWMIVLFLFLRGNPEWVCPHYWYQTENAAVLLIVAVLGCETALKRPDNRWFRLLIAPRRRVRDLFHPLLLALVAGAGMSHYFYAQSFYGASSYQDILRYPDCTAAVQKIKALIPPGDTIIADARTASHFIIRNRMHELGVWPGKSDWVVYDLEEKRLVGWPLHMSMMNAPDLQLSGYFPYPGHEYYIFKQTADKTIVSPLRRLTEAEWQSSGRVVALPEYGDLFEVRVEPVKTETGNLELLFHLRLRQKTSGKVSIRLGAAGGAREIAETVPYGWGRYPVDWAEPGEVFTIPWRLPETMSHPETVGIKIIKNAD